MKINLARAGMVAGLAAASIAALVPAAQAHDDKPQKTTTKEGKTQPVKLRFAGVAGTTPVACGDTISGLGTTGADAQLTDFRFFLSDVKLIKANGKAVRVALKKNAFQTGKGINQTALIDLEDGSGRCEEGTPQTNALIQGSVPKGRYVGASWTLGVPFKMNHTDATTAPSPLNSLAMAWSWQVGRKFTKIEIGDPGAPSAGTWQTPSFLVHIGSTGCEGNPANGQTVKCAAPNRAKIKLAKLNPAKQQVAVDLKALLANNDVTRNGGAAPGCMSGPSDPECPGVFGAFGMTFKTVAGTDTDDGMGMTGMRAATPRQTVFRAVKR